MLAGGAVSWRAQKQPLVAFSTVEVEYIGASDAAKEAIWIQSLYSRVLYGQTLYKHTDHCPHCLCLVDSGISPTKEPQEIFIDNQGAIQQAKNPKFHELTKHISVRFHFIRDACERKAIKTTYLRNIRHAHREKNISHWERVHAPSACNAFTENPLLRMRGLTQISVATKNIRNNADINHFRYQRRSRSLTKTPYYERDPIV